MENAAAVTPGPARTPSAPGPSAARHGAPAPSARFRTDIEGFRAIAVAMVVAFHAGMPEITGGYVGVDVFYVISGFLITGLLAEELERTGTISFRAFYARRVRRLLPMTSLVLAAIAIGMLFFTPPVFRPAVRFDAIAAALHYSNWQFALESVNYLTLGSAQNPVLHYWSLSVEEQFYLLWPLVLLAAVRFPWGRGHTRAGRRRLAFGIAAVGLASLVYSVIATPAEPAIAYFATTTRAWEFAAGGGLALLAPRLRRTPRAVAIALGGAGLVAVVLPAFAYGALTEFPGTAALAPVLGATAVLAGGARQPLRGVAALLSLPPVRYVGRISYAWYLWHWPCLVFSRTAQWSLPRGQPAWWVTVLVVALSFALAALTHALVEVPLRRAPWFTGRRVLPVAASMTGAAVLALTLAGGPLILPGATFASANAGTGVAMPPAATPLEAAASTAYTAMHGCHVGYGATAPAAGCVFGDARVRRTVVLLGDSHAAQWFPALETLALRERFRLVAWTKSGCPFALGVHIFLPAIGRDYSECLAWQQAVLEQLRAMPRPAMVILGRTSTYLPQVLTPDGEQASANKAAAIWGAGMKESVDALRRRTARVIVLRDTPHAPTDVPGCISWDPSEPAACDFPRPRDGHWDDSEYRAERAAGVPRYLYADPRGAVCPGRVCHVVVNGVVVFRDDNHLTAAFAARRWRQFAGALNLPFFRRPI